MAKAVCKRLPLERLNDIVLLHGSHEKRGDGVCAMELVAWLAGERHSDQPICACPVLGAFVRAWNDAVRDEDL